MRELESERKSFPPLSQSRYGDMACETLYVCKHVQCARLGESEPAARGTEIHQILSTYINHLVRVRRSTDPEVFDTLMKGASSEVREVLERFRGNHTFDPEKILATELHIELDHDFHPVEDSDDEGPAVEYEGTLDLVMLHSLKEAGIDDWKSYYQIIDAGSFQSKFYPLLLMCLNPSLETVKFVLEFVRYGVSRCVEYTRKDLSWLKELAQRERARQRKLHELAASGERALKASPGRHCTWCPLLLNGCPVATTNPYGQMTAEERLRFALWLQEAEKQNTKVLKDLMVERGPIEYRDGNQAEYLADFVPVEKKFYLYRDAIGILNEWFRVHPDEQPLGDKLTVSGLSSPLKAEKRAELAEKLTRIADLRVGTEFRIAKRKQWLTAAISAPHCSGSLQRQHLAQVGSLTVQSSLRYTAPMCQKPILLGTSSFTASGWRHEAVRLPRLLRGGIRHGRDRLDFLRLSHRSNG